MQTVSRFTHRETLWVELGQVQGVKGSDLISLLSWVLARDEDILFLPSQSSLASMRPKESGVH